MLPDIYHFRHTTVEADHPNSKRIIKSERSLDTKVTEVVRRVMHEIMDLLILVRKVAPGFFEREKVEGLPTFTINAKVAKGKKEVDHCPIRPLLPFEKDIEGAKKAKLAGGSLFPTRADFTEKEWKRLDGINFNILKGHLKKLCPTCDAYQKMQPFTTKKVDLAESKVSEILSKGLAYLDSDVVDGKIIQIPTLQKEGTFKLLPYTIKKETLGTGLPIFILTPPDGSDAPIRVVIRGTEPYFDEEKSGKKGAKESLYADTISSKGVGAKVIQEEKLALFDELNLSGAIITGHSLGATLATILAVRLAERQNPFSQAKPICAYGFNAAAVDTATKASYDVMKKTRQPQITTYLAEGDIVSSAGKKWIGDVYGTKLSNSKEINPLVQHTMHMIEQGTNLFIVDIAKENEKLARKVSEGARSGAGKLIKLILYITQSLPHWAQTKAP
jgi:hypothetical protein